MTTPLERPALIDRLDDAADALDLGDKESPFGLQLVGEDVVNLAALLRDAAIALAALPAAPAPEGQLPSPKLHHVCVDGKVKPFSLDICANCYWANRADVGGQTDPGAR